MAKRLRISDKKLWEHLQQNEDPKLKEAGIRLQEYRQALDIATPIMPIMENIFKFLIGVKETGHPQVCEMVIALQNDGEPATITLWAGPGLVTPMMRISELRNLNQKMAEQLAAALSLPMSIEQSDAIELIISEYRKIQKENPPKK